MAISNRIDYIGMIKFFESSDQWCRSYPRMSRSYISKDLCRSEDKTTRTKDEYLSSSSSQEME
jgi:hypothetical protein